MYEEFMSQRMRSADVAPAISVVVPVYNEAAGIAAFLKPLLARAAEQAHAVEILVVDGGSCDATVALVRSFGVVCLAGPRGRARQMNFAAAAARGRFLLFLHCDTLLPANFAACTELVIKRDAPWGFFRLALSGRGGAFRVIEKAISYRSATTAIATGDQGIFVRRDVWDTLGGYRDIALMEDVELCARLRKRHKPLVLAAEVTTSSRRWEQKGVVKTVLLMWCLRAGYALGISAATLARWYR